MMVKSALPFQAIVHVQEQFAERGFQQGAADEFGGGGSGFLVRLLDLVVRAEQIHGFLIFAARFEQKPRAREFGIGDAAGKRQLFVRPAACPPRN